MSIMRFEQAPDVGGDHVDSLGWDSDVPWVCVGQPLVCQLQGSRASDVNISCNDQYGLTIV